MPTSKLIYVIAGEASGDAHAARMLTELNKIAPNYIVKGIGGDKMRATGAETFVDFSELAVMGLIEVIKRYRSLKKIFNRTVELLKIDRPDLLILVDYPGFNLKLAKEAKALGIEVLYYISPKVWAWRAGRVKTIKQYVDHMAVLFPFEVPIYQEAGVPVTCVGHPLVDAVKKELTIEQAKTKLNINSAQKVLGLFPGSRRSEVDVLLPIMIESAQRISKKIANLNVVVPLATGLDRKIVAPMLAKSALDIKLIDDDFYQLTSACDAVVAASGTVTLEIALLGVPHFISYRVSPISYAVLSRFVKIPYVGLCNIVTGENVVLELLQNEVTAERFEKELMSLLTLVDSKPQAERIRQQVLADLGPSGGAHNMADLVVSLLKEVG
ncbi:MAG: lipid-A-disaccharide synthase [Methylophaga sp.]|nr:MAG: lipid-A-disaccharide synthase [Methylophaga sp.]